jgi:hypothetical protein
MISRMCSHSIVLAVENAGKMIGGGAGCLGRERRELKMDQN